MKDYPSLKATFSETFLVMFLCTVTYSVLSSTLNSFLCYFFCFVFFAELDESVTRLKLRIKAKADGVIIAEWNPPPSDKLSLFIYYCRKNSVDHNMCDVSLHCFFCLCLMFCLFTCSKES